MLAVTHCDMLALEALPFLHTPLYDLVRSERFGKWRMDASQLFTPFGVNPLKRGNIKDPSPNDTRPYASWSRTIKTVLTTVDNGRFLLTYVWPQDAPSKGSAQPAALKPQFQA